MKHDPEKRRDSKGKGKGSPSSCRRRKSLGKGSPKSTTCFEEERVSRKELPVIIDINLSAAFTIRKLQTWESVCIQTYRKGWRRTKEAK